MQLALTNRFPILTAIAIAAICLSSVSCKKAPSPETAPSETVATNDVALDNAQNADTPNEALSEDNVAPEDIPDADTPNEDLSEDSVAAEDIPDEDTPSEDLSENNAPEDTDNEQDSKVIATPDSPCASKQLMKVSQRSGNTTQYGIIDADGNVVVPAKYNAIKSPICLDTGVFLFIDDISECDNDEDFCDKIEMIRSYPKTSLKLVGIKAQSIDFSAPEDGFFKVYYNNCGEGECNQVVLNTRGEVVMDAALHKEGRFVEIDIEDCDGEPCAVVRARCRCCGPGGYESMDNCGLYSLLTGKRLNQTKLEACLTKQAGVFPVKVAKKGWGFMDPRGKMLVPAQFKDIGTFGEGRFPIQRNGLWAYVDKDGKEEISPRFDWAGPFAQGRAMVKLNIDQARELCGDSGKTPQTGNKNVLAACKEGFAPWERALKENERERRESPWAYKPFEEFGWAYIDAQGQVISRFDYTNFNWDGYEYVATSFINGLARVERGGLYGYIDINGHEVIAPQFVRAEDFSNNRALVELTFAQVKALCGHSEPSSPSKNKNVLKACENLNLNNAKTFSAYINTKGEVISLE
ncbi:MAG: WG repeat-containing protein [Proteobacteria bacterium]|nr:WG repeat-containing protein [Pseudomonadota bacterium]